MSKEKRWRLKERIRKEKEMENERKWAKIRKGDREVKQRGIKKRGRGKKDSEGEKLKRRRSAERTKKETEREKEKEMEKEKKSKRKGRLRREKYGEGS
jgi:hypothetical protein